MFRDRRVTAVLFLIEYDRNRGRLVALTTFEDGARDAADDARLDLELRLSRRGLQREVVLLEAATEDDLRRTHRRYFEGLNELAHTRPTRGPKRVAEGLPNTPHEGDEQ